MPTTDIALQFSDRIRHFGLTDTTGTFGPVSPVFTDTVILSDVLGIQEDGFLSIPLEGLTLSDSDIVALGWMAILADSFSLNDNFDGLTVGIAFALSDAISLSDATNFTGSGISLPISDTLSLSDALKVVTGVNASFTESLTIADSIDPFAPDALGFSDSLVISDAVTVDDGTGSIAISMTNTITFSDAARVVLGVGYNSSDTLALADIETALERGFLTVADQIALSDILQVKAPIQGFEVHDSLLFTEAVILKYGNRIDPGDALNLLDSILLNLKNIDPAVSDAFTLSDAIAIRLSTANVVFTDALALSDSVTFRLNTNLRVQSSDTLALIDSLSTTSYTDFIDYVRKYLNDVACDSNVGS